MGDKSGISWTDATWNPIVGCSIVSPGCTNCYAMQMANRIERMQPASHYAGTTKVVNGNPVWTGKLVMAPEHILLQPLKWKRPRRIFVNSMSDLFHESVPDEWIDKVFAVMALSPQHTFQVLTKRSKRMREYFAEQWQGTPAQTIKFADGTSIDMPAGGPTGRRSMVDEAIEDVFILRPAMVNTENPYLWDESDSLKSKKFAWPLINVHLGVSCEDQTRADERIPDLLATPAAARFVSADPLLGPIDFRYQWLEGAKITDFARIDQIIVGGESGRDFRPMKIRWAEIIMRVCTMTGTAFFFKQDSGPRPGMRGDATGELWACKQMVGDP